MIDLDQSDFAERFATMLAESRRSSILQSVDLHEDISNDVATGPLVSTRELGPFEFGNRRERIGRPFFELEVSAYLPTNNWKKTVANLVQRAVATEEALVCEGAPTDADPTEHSLEQWLRSTIQVDTRSNSESRVVLSEGAARTLAADGHLAEVKALTGAEPLYWSRERPTVVVPKGWASLWIAQDWKLAFAERLVSATAVLRNEANWDQPWWFSPTIELTSGEPSAAPNASRAAPGGH